MRRKRYRGPDARQVEAIVKEIHHLESLMKAWADGPPIKIYVAGARTTPKDLVETLSALAEPWERAHAAWETLRELDVMRGENSRADIGFLRAVRGGVAAKIGPDEALRLLGFPRRYRKPLTRRELEERERSRIGRANEEPLASD